MPSYENIEHFSGAAADWDACMERLEQYLIASNLGEIAIGDNNAGVVQACEDATRTVVCSSTSACLMRVIENLLKDVRGVSVYLDDILVRCRSDTEHLQNLQEVLKNLPQSGLKLAKEK